MSTTSIDSFLNNNNNYNSDDFQISLDTALQIHSTCPPDKVRFVDGTWTLPTPSTTTTTTTPRHQFEQGPRIPNAIFLDIDDLADKSTNLPHMMPSAALWNAYMNAYSITNEHFLIVYGQTTNCMYLHRAFVQLLSMGHSKLYLCTASLEEWQAAGGPVDTLPQTVLTAEQVQKGNNPAGTYQATEPQAVIDKTTLLSLLQQKHKKYRIVDVRSPDRFYGRVDEPRPGLRKGHIPGSENLFFASLLQETAPCRLKPKSELKVMLKDYLEDQRKTTIVSLCGSGATACTLKAALMLCGRDPNSIVLYDGSWCEWGADPDTPIVTDDDDV